MLGNLAAIHGALAPDGHTNERPHIRSELHFRRLNGDNITLIVPDRSTPPPNAA